MSDFLKLLRAVNASRLTAWEAGNKADALFHAVELGGEVGELLNVAKKLHREQMGWVGSSSDLQDLSDEIGDVLICLDKLAQQYGIDLEDATAAKFDRTSAKHGFPHSLLDPLMCDHCGARQGGRATHCAPPFDVQPHQFSGARGGIPKATGAA